MGADNTWAGRVTITPPLTWQECKLSPGVEDVTFDFHEEDGVLGRIITAVAVIPARANDSWASGTGHDLQVLIDAHPGHEFTGSLRVDWDPVYGEDQVLAERWTVAGRTVVHEQARLAWSGDEDPALTEARDLAKLALGILEDMPTCLDEFHPDLDDERLPGWAGGEAETWQRGDES